jgi:hypothetical protein
MSVLRGKVTWSISINILHVNIYIELQECLNYLRVPSITCHMQRSSLVLGFSVLISAMLDKLFQYVIMALATSEMHRSPAIVVLTLIYQTIYIGVIPLHKLLDSSEVSLFD